MRYALFADIHSNLEAFLAVRKEFKKEKVDEYVCLGDIVGYAANPNECFKLTRELNPLTIIAGNHDWASVGKTDIDYFHSLAREAILWTQEELTEENKGFLRSFSLIKEFDDFVIVHGSLYSPEKWHYIFTLRDAKKNFEHQNGKICFIAHSHQPFIISQDREGKCEGVKGMRVSLRDDYKYLINIGSVGQPRDGNPDACYCLYDRDKNKIEIKRIPYQIKKAQDKIISAGLPQKLAQRLSLGR
ncbi:MAG TPA: metallophosphoesterase [bacterium]|nr:metallophosphoesterase [bacterium]